MEFFRSRILGREWLNDLYYMLTLERPDDFDYMPGQFIAVRRGDDKRYYSLASHPSEDNLQLIIKKKPNGKFSEWLASFNGTLEISNAIGKMRPYGKRIAMIANGSGIVPFISFIKHFSINGIEKAMLIYGEKTRKDMIYYDWFSSFEWLDFIPVTSREGERKHVQDYFEKVVEFSPDRVYAVGSLAMALDARKFFREKGIEIEAEGFG